MSVVCSEDMRGDWWSNESSIAQQYRLIPIEDILYDYVGHERPKCKFMRPNLNAPRTNGVTLYYYYYYWNRFVRHINDSSRCYLSNFNFILHVWNIYGFFISQMQKLGATNAPATLEYTNEINHLFRSWIAFTDWCIHIRTRIANIAQPDIAFAVCR